MVNRISIWIREAISFAWALSHPSEAGGNAPFNTVRIQSEIRKKIFVTVNEVEEWNLYVFWIYTVYIAIKIEK